MSLRERQQTGLQHAEVETARQQLLLPLTTLRLCLAAPCRQLVARVSRGQRLAVVAQAAPAKYDYDLVIIGCGVGGHGAALHAVEQVGGRDALTRRAGQMNEHREQLLHSPTVPKKAAPTPVWHKRALT